jgi:hypothetical protein
LAFIIGDNQGGDQICGRNISDGMLAKRISRSWDAIPAKYLNVEKYSCSFLQMENIKALELVEAWHQLRTCIRLKVVFRFLMLISYTFRGDLGLK